MHTALIQGVVCGGAGHVHKLPAEVLGERRKATGLHLVPGTFNVRVEDLAGAVEALGPPAFELPGPERLGPLRFWRVSVVVHAGDNVQVIAPGFVVRHERTGTRYLEIVSDEHFRSMGVTDGHPVLIEPRA